MLHLLSVEQVQGQLRKVSLLVEQYEARHSNFVANVKGWLQETEGLLLQHHMSEASRISSLRALVTSVQRGLVSPEVTMRQNSSIRATRQATAVHALRESERILTARLQPEVARFSEAERLMQQIVVAAEAKDLLSADLSGLSHTDRLRTIFGMIESDPNLSAGLANVKGSVRGQDYLVLLDRALPIPA